MYIKDIENLEYYFQHIRMCIFCCSNTNFVPSKLLLNLQHFYQDFRLSWRSFIGFCVYQVYREHRLSVFPFIRFCVYPIVSCVYPIVSCVNPILSCVYRVLSCIMSRITLRVLYKKSYSMQTQAGSWSRTNKMHLGMCWWKKPKCIFHNSSYINSLILCMPQPGIHKVSLNPCESFRRSCGQQLISDRQTDRQTDRVKPIYPPKLRLRGV